MTERPACEKPDTVPVTANPALDVRCQVHRQSIAVRGEEGVCYALVEVTSRPDGAATEAEASAISLVMRLRLAEGVQIVGLRGVFPVTGQISGAVDDDGARVFQLEDLASGTTDGYLLDLRIPRKEDGAHCIARVSVMGRRADVELSEITVPVDVCYSSAGHGLPCPSVLRHVDPLPPFEFNTEPQGRRESPPSMTEAEWNTCTDPRPMLEFLEGKASDRKLRLFAVACCRRIWHLLSDERSRKAIEVAERYAEGVVRGTELETAYEAACGVTNGVGNTWDAAQDLGSRYFSEAFDGVAGAAAYAAIWAANSDDLLDVGFVANAVTFASQAPTRKDAAWLLQDVFGPLPFRLVTLDPIWLTNTVTSLAQAIYTDHAFDRLPILADALEDAGCTNADILNHCRQPGVHVLGCWVVDLLLGKE